MSNEDIIQTAMSIILHAGNARNLCRDAALKINNSDLNDIDMQLKEAEEEILLAHKAQTDILHLEAKGERVEMTVLLSHAQDTLMAVESEKYLIQMFYNYVKDGK